MKFIIDTNVLVYMVKENKDIIKQIKENFGKKTDIYILKKTKEEIESLESRKILNANVLKMILSRYNIREKTFSGKDADSQLVEASKKGYIVITNDKELQKEIKSNQGKFIVYGKKGLMNLEEVL